MTPPTYGEVMGLPTEPTEFVPNSKRFRPRDVVGACLSMQSYYLAPGQFGRYRQAAIACWYDKLAEDIGKNAFGAGLEKIDELVSPTINRLQTARLYLVQPQMADLIREASKSLPSYQLHRDDMPVRTGYVIFANEFVTPIGQEYDEAIRGFIWDVLDDGRLNVIWLASQVMTNSRMPTTIGIAPQCWQLGEDWDSEADAWQTMVLAFFRLLEANWVSIDSTRSKKRRGANGKKEQPSDVRVVYLRSAERKDGEPTGEGGGGNYSHRWWVSGHWRQQWYPSRQANQPVWIQGYVKGPDDKPLITKTDVTVIK